MMASDTASLKSAFKRFVELVEPIEDVYYVTAIEPRRPDIFTYIRVPDNEVMTRIFSAEKVVNNEFPEILVDFHIVFLQDRPIEDFVRPLPELMYVRQDLKRKEMKRGVKG